MHLLQATKPAGADVEVFSSVHGEEGLQLVTVVVPGSTGAGVGQTYLSQLGDAEDSKRQ